MESRSRLTILYLTSLLCGFCMMALEMLGGRFLQPVFGSSIDVWAAIISVFILSLSIGYVLGGRMADRARSNTVLGWVIVISGLFYLLLPVYARPFVELLGPGIHAARWGALPAALVLFLPPSLLLGCVSPLLVTLALTDVGRVGRTTGMLYAIGSFGNVLGVLISDYVLLARYELNANVLAMGLSLGLIGLFHLARPMTSLAAQGERTPARSTAG